MTGPNEMDHLEVQIEVVSRNDAEHVRTRVEQAIYHAFVAADSHRGETGYACAFRAEGPALPAPPANFRKSAVLIEPFLYT